jgi:hypothetical protein
MSTAHFDRAKSIFGRMTLKAFAFVSKMRALQTFAAANGILSSIRRVGKLAYTWWRQNQRRALRENLSVVFCTFFSPWK